MLYKGDKNLSIFISGKNCPDTCEKCDLKKYVGSRNLISVGSETLYECPFNSELFTLKTSKRQTSCQLRKVPEYHGRLIDADELFAHIEQMKIIGTIDNENDSAVSLCEVLNLIDKAPTIIEAEESNASNN